MSVPSPGMAGGNRPDVRVVGGDRALQDELQEALARADLDAPAGTALLVLVVPPAQRHRLGSLEAMWEGDLLEHGPLVVDRRRRTVSLRGELLELAAKEFDLLEHLATFPFRVFTRQELLEQVWRSSTEWQQARTVNEHVHRLRRKLGDEWIVTVRGVGYRFEPQPPRGSAD